MATKRHKIASQWHQKRQQMSFNTCQNDSNIALRLSEPDRAPHTKFKYKSNHFNIELSFGRRSARSA